MIIKLKIKLLDIYEKITKLEQLIITKHILIDEEV